MPNFTFLSLSSDQISIRIPEAHWLFWSLGRLESQGKVEERFGSALDFDNFAAGSTIARRLSGSRLFSDKSHNFDLRFHQPLIFPSRCFCPPVLFLWLSPTELPWPVDSSLKKHFKFYYISNKEKYIFYFSNPEFQKPLISNYSVTK